MNPRLPAEWERHEATWLIWPHKLDDWPGKFNTIKWVYCEIIRHISRSELVRLIVDNEKDEKKVRYYLNKSHIDPDIIEYYHIKSDRSWIRDTGPFYCIEDNKLHAVRFSFNGWGKYRDFKQDDKVPGKIIENMNYKFVDAVEGNKRMVLEGGSIDVNGKGTLISTEQCLLSSDKQVRNKNFNSADYERIFSKYFGINNVIWLKDGISGDDTNGHIDDFCRLVSNNTVIMCEENNIYDPNCKILNENFEILSGAKTEDGSNFEIIRLPMPEPLYYDNQRLPASYANFYITNSTILVPTFNDANDYKALGIFREIFRNRQVIGINSTDLILGLGSIHCLTKEQAANH